VAHEPPDRNGSPVLWDPAHGCHADHQPGRCLTLARPLGAVPANTEAAAVAWLTIAGLVFDLLGAAVLAFGLFIDEDEALKLGLSEYEFDTRPPEGLSGWSCVVMFARTSFHVLVAVKDDGEVLSAALVPRQVLNPPTATVYEGSPAQPKP
jgi:hypothetical protein